MIRQHALDAIHELGSPKRLGQIGTSARAEVAPEQLFLSVGCSPRIHARRVLAGGSPGSDGSIDIARRSSRPSHATARGASSTFWGDPSTRIVVTSVIVIIELAVPPSSELDASAARLTGGAERARRVAPFRRVVPTRCNAPPGSRGTRLV